MNTKKALFILAATVAAGSNVYADKVSLEQTPPAVRQAIQSKAGGAPIEDIDRENRNGQVVYEASFKQGSTQQEILVSEQGTILRDVVGPSGGLANSAITLANKSAIPLTAAPPAVQRAIQAHSRGATIESVDKGIWNGQNIYEAAYTQNGQRVTYQVTESGKPVISPVPLTGGQTVANATQQQLSLKSPLPNSVNMQLRDAPPVVQATVHKARNGERVEHFERGEANGRSVYQVGFRKDGQPMLAQILDNGTLLRQGPGSWTATQSTSASTPSSAPAATTAGEPRYAGLSASNVPLSGGAKVALTEAPSAVQRTVRQMAGASRVEDFERGQWNGRTVYEAAFKRNGQHTELQVLEDGSILTQGLTVGASPSGQKGVATGTEFQRRYAGLADGNVPLSGGSKLAFDAAPQPVKDAVNSIAAGAPIEDMERGTWNGRTIYEAAFKKNGQHMELQVLDDGSYVTRGPASAVGAPAAGTSATNQQ